MLKTKMLVIYLVVLTFFIACNKDEPIDKEDDNPVEETINVYTFYYDNVKYEIVKNKKNWEDAAAIAVERGGYLIEINDQAENDAAFNALADAEISANLTVAADGGMASYLWTGGNDATEEGTWVWNGDNDDAYTVFWRGETDGTAEEGMFTNWGNEPDNYSNQDGLGLAMTDWPRGEAGQWNDIKIDNNLYFIIEFPRE